jgi:hypothetical protein
MNVKCGSKAMKGVIGEIPEDLVVYQDEGNGLIITSYMRAGGLCNVPCDQLLDHCPTSGRRKMGAMSSVLERIVHDEVALSKVLVSHNLGGEVGFVDGPELMSFLNEVRKAKPPFELAVGTACNCHGILNFFTVCARP